MTKGYGETAMKNVTLLVFVAATLLMTGCSRYQLAFSPQGSIYKINTRTGKTWSSDGRMWTKMPAKSMDTVTHDAREVIEFESPVSFGPLINTSSYESSPFLTPDGHTLYFSSDRPGGHGRKDIYVSHKVNG